MTNRAHARTRDEEDTDPARAAAESDASKPGFIKRLAGGLALRILPPIIAAILAAVGAFIALQQQVGAVVSEVETVRQRGDANAAQIVAVTDALSKLALAQGSIVSRLDAADVARAQFWSVHWPSLMTRLDHTDAKLDRILEAMSRRSP